MEASYFSSASSTPNSEWLKPVLYILVARIYGICQHPPPSCPYNELNPRQRGEPPHKHARFPQPVSQSHKHTRFREGVLAADRWGVVVSECIVCRMGRLLYLVLSSERYSIPNKTWFIRDTRKYQVFVYNVNCGCR